MLCYDTITVSEPAPRLDYRNLLLDKIDKELLNDQIMLELSLEDQVKAEARLDVSLVPPKPKPKRTTKLNGWLFERWEKWDKPNARHFAHRLKPFQCVLGSPVKKYHGWNPDIVVEWVEGWGSPKGSWGSRAFENKITTFRKEDRDAIDK